MLRKVVLSCLASIACAGVVSFASTSQADPTTLKVGTLAPAESPWGTVFKVWQRGVKERTNGGVELQFFWNGQQGDEVAMVGKMRTGQLDAAAITATGLAQVYKSVLVLQLPGLFTTWAKLDKARNAMRPMFEPEFESQGFKILGWGDVGIGHLMSKGFEIRVPNDLRHKNVYFLSGDPIESTFYSLIGEVTPKQLTVPEILPALNSGTINVVNAPALAAEQLQWSSHLDHINTSASGIGIGALVFSSAKFKSLPADVQQILIETGKVTGDALTVRIRREDDAAFGRLKSRMAAYAPNPDEQKQWEDLFAKTRAALTGRQFKPELVQAAIDNSH
jgi:TRAP-type C4-dicarboxylate transport system substrate-binding protein